MNCIATFLYDWQTLISGILAVGAASVGALLLRQQIAQSEKHERSRLRARFASARAVLPLALNEVAEYAIAQISALVEFHGACRRRTLRQSAPAIHSVEIPGNVVGLLREAIEALDAEGKPNALELISDIISEIQVLAARVGSLGAQLDSSGSAGQTLQSEEFIVQAARLYALAASLFPFARREMDDGPQAVDWNDAVNRLRTSNVEIPGVHQILERKLQKSLVTWMAKGAAQ